MIADVVDVRRNGVTRAESPLVGASGRSAVSDASSLAEPGLLHE